MTNSESQILFFALLLTMVMIGTSPTTSIRYTVSITDSSLIWVALQHTQIVFRFLYPSVTRVASIRFRHNWRSSQIWANPISIPKNRYVLQFRRFISGVCRWNFRFLTGGCPPTRWYGGFTWVFDPGIHGVHTLLGGLKILRNRIGYGSQTKMSLIDATIGFNLFIFGSEYVYFKYDNGLFSFGHLSCDLRYVSSWMVAKKQWWEEIRNKNPKIIRMWIESRSKNRLRKPSWMNGFQFAHQGFQIFRDQVGRNNQGIHIVIDAFPITLSMDHIEEMVMTNHFLLVMVSLNPQKQNLGTMTSQIPHGWTVGDDDADRGVGSITSQVVSLNNRILRRDLWSFQVSYRDLLKFGKKLFSKDVKVAIATTVKLFVIMLKKVTEARYSRKTLVRKPWYHYVYISELCLDTSGLQLRFAKRKFSHKMLHANRNKEKSNMKLDNNRSYDRLASKTTLRKASSISLLLYFS